MDAFSLFFYYYFKNNELQVPRTEGNDKGKGNYWSFASGCESMLDLFENGNYRRRRRRKNVKREPRDKRPNGGSDCLQALSPVDSGFPGINSCPGQRVQSQPKALETCELFPNAAASRESLNSSSIGKSDSEIKFSIDYILSSPDPLPVLRSPYHTEDNKYHLLDSQQLVNLQFWTMWACKLGGKLRRKQGTFFCPTVTAVIPRNRRLDASLGYSVSQKWISLRLETYH